MLSVPTAGGPEAVLVADEEGVYQIAATSSCLYWTTAYLKENHLRAMPKSGGDPISIAPIDNQIQAIAADASGVYWGERDNHRLMRATK